MKLKKILSVLILIFVSFVCLAGCADIEFIRMVDSYHAIMDRFVITLDKNKLGSQYLSVKNAVYDDMVAFRNYVNTWIGGFTDSYPDVYLKLKEGIVCQEVSDKDNQLSLTIEFEDTYCFGMFYGLVNSEEVEYTKAMEDKGPFVSKMLMQKYQTEEMGLFLYKYSMITSKSFLSDLGAYSLDGIDTNYYNKYDELVTGYSIADVNVSQVFAYPDDRIYSNADIREVSDGFTFLYWDLSNKGEDFELAIYKIAPEVAIWYITGLIVSVVAIIVMYIVLRSKSKNTIDVKITKKDVEKDE